MPTAACSFLVCLVASPCLLGEPGIVVARGAIQPQVSVGADGSVHVVCIQGGNIAVTVSRDRGETFLPPVVALDAQGRAAGGAQRGPRIGVDAKGAITVSAWVVTDKAELEKRYPTGELYLTRSQDGGKTWSAPLRVNEVEKKAPEALHWMAIAPSGEAHLAWLDLRDRPSGGQDLFHARVAGGKVEKNMRLAENICECCAPGLALDGVGNALIAWREGGDKPSREIVASLAKSGTLAEPVRLNKDPSQLTTCPMSAPAVAVSADGKKMVAAWMDERAGQGEKRVYWTSWSGGAPVEDAKIHAAGTRQDHPAIAIDAAGTVWAAWEEGRSKERSIWARSSPGDEPHRLSTQGEGVASFPAVAAGGDVVVIVYEARDEGGKKGEERVVLRRLR